MPRVRFAGQFLDNAQEIRSDRLRGQLRQVISMIQAFPESGSPVVRPFLTRAFGPNVRTCQMSPFVLVYEYDRDEDVVMVYALVPQKSVR